MLLGQPTSQPARWAKVFVVIAIQHSNHFRTFLYICAQCSKSYSEFQNKHCVSAHTMFITCPDKLGRHCVMCKHCSIVNRHAKMPFGLSIKFYFVNSLRSFIWILNVHAFLNGGFRLLFHISVQFNFIIFFILFFFFDLLTFNFRIDDSRTIIIATENHYNNFKNANIVIGIWDPKGSVNIIVFFCIKFHISSVNRNNSKSQLLLVLLFCF